MADTFTRRMFVCLPVRALARSVAFFASLGLPGLCGFVSEFTVFLGSLATWQTLTIISALSVIITAAYYLWAIQRMMLGTLNEKYLTLPEITGIARKSRTLTAWPLSTRTNRALSRPALPRTW